MDSTSLPVPANAGTPTALVAVQSMQLKPADSPVLLPPSETIDALASAIASEASHLVTQFVSRGNPLDDPQLSSWVWLRSDGSIEVVYDSDRSGRGLKGETRGSLLIDVFKCQRDATPSSKFHRWVEDPNGNFIGDLSGKVTTGRPLWERLPRLPSARMEMVQKVIAVLDFKRFRLVPYTANQLQMEVSGQLALRALKARVTSWLLHGDYSFVVERLTLRGLAAAAKAHGQQFVRAVGPDKFYLALSSQVKATLLDAHQRN